MSEIKVLKVLYVVLMVFTLIGIIDVITRHPYEVTKENIKSYFKQKNIK